MRVVQVNFAYDRRLPSPAALLDRYSTLTGWSESLAKAGADVLTVQRFHHSATHIRHGLRYCFGTGGEISREAAAFAPLDRILIETDAPYLAPVPHRGRKNEPAYIAQTLAALAALRALPAAEVDAATSANARRLFGLPLPSGSADTLSAS